MRLDAYAERFRAAGYACLVFDYRNFGDSEGAPRQLLDIRMQLQDWTVAVAYSRTLAGIDHNRIGLWGTSFSGGHVIATAARLPLCSASSARPSARHNATLSGARASPPSHRATAAAGSCAEVAAPAAAIRAST